jgi:hypothetical protein
MMYSSLDVLFVVLSLPAAWGTFSVYKLGEDTDVSMTDHPPGREAAELERLGARGGTVGGCRHADSAYRVLPCAHVQRAQ